MPLLAVNHHYYRASGTGKGIYPTTPSDLKAKVDAIRSGGWSIGGQRHIRSYLDGDSADERLCVLTFDDGLKEQMQAVALLETLGASAVCFVPTAPLIEKRVLDVHKLHMVRSVSDDQALAAQLDNAFGFASHEFDEHVLASTYRYDVPLSRRVKYFLNFTLTAEQRDGWISACFVDLFGDERAAAEALYMSNDDLAFIARRGLLGSHGHAHLPMAQLSVDALRDELQKSGDILADLSGTRPVGVSYPYGGKSAVSNQVFSMAAGLGYAYGFTMERGRNAGTAVPLALKRVDTNDLADWLS
jgi:peptidoglycan/xylan/chitin deacetylase (PgdA/CDA1 family)